MDDLCKLLVDKGTLKEKVVASTAQTMAYFKEAAAEFEGHFKTRFAKEHPDIEVAYHPKSPHELQLKFAGDILLFIMHPDVFEFPRNHEVMRSQYISEDRGRSYCGMIQIFNFLSNSFKYARIHDLGYMIGRILINSEGHYFVEGKRELAQILNNFTAHEMTPDSAREILHSAIRYTVNFDLLLPNYDQSKEIPLHDILQMEDSMSVGTTAKRLGFRFEKDKDEE